ncbi:MAG: peptidoglycan recognition family protein, partial [Chloroflexota bacterium]
TINYQWTKAQERIRIERVHGQHLANGWPGIAYHFYVFHHRIYYTGDWATVRYHTAGVDDPATRQIVSSYNEDGIAVCLAGDFTKRPPRPGQLVLARKLIENLRFLFERPLPVFAHRTLTPTACPGDSWPRWGYRLGAPQ